MSLRLAGAERPSVASSSATAAAEQQQQPQQEQEPQRQEEQQQQPMLHTGPDVRFELLSLVGTLSPDGVHLHVSLGDEEGAVCGGHLVRAIVHTTAEVVIGVASSLAFSREMDPSTGFKELVISSSVRRGAVTHEQVKETFWDTLRGAIPVVMISGVVTVCVIQLFMLPLSGMESR